MMIFITMNLQWKADRLSFLKVRSGCSERVLSCGFVCRLLFSIYVWMEFCVFRWEMTVLVRGLFDYGRILAGILRIILNAAHARAYEWRWLLLGIGGVAVFLFSDIKGYRSLFVLGLDREANLVSHQDQDILDSKHELWKMMYFDFILIVVLGWLCIVFELLTWCDVIFCY